jgi:hypothetical protein
MKYILASNDDKSPTIEKITEHPIEYVSKFEPIDVINGKMIAWDELGTLYHFGPNKSLGESNATKNVAIVETGHWQLDQDEPRLLKIGEGKTEELKSTLMDILSNHSHSRFFWWKKAKNTVEPKYATLDLAQLIKLAEERLK